MSSIKVNREALLSCLNSVQPGLSTREVIEQSSCFVFQDGKVMTFNDEVSCSVKSGLGKTLKGAVAAKPLLALLEKLPEEEIDITTTEDEFLVSGVRRQSGIRLEAEVLLSLSSVEEPGEWKELPTDFDEAVSIASSCSGTDASRFSLTCVHFHPKYLESCDNFQLIRYKIKTGISQEFLVRRDSLKHLTSLGMTHIAESQTWLHFKSPTGLVMSCRRYLEEYHNLSEVLSVSGEEIVLPGGLAEAVDKAQIFSSENTDDDKVFVELRPNKIRIKGQGLTGWFQETKKLKYSGPLMNFLISPKMLIEITKKQSHSEICEGRFKVKGERFVYISLLSKTENDKEEPATANEE